ncbi:MAG: hypothetical protein KatS3mg115_1384 [Candidatus Poribacteria bacterium]|nr:MAG: hypothetical protein KatS3mg115_1384 [Candidatus Poribacteria bacterium]
MSVILGQLGAVFAPVEEVGLTNVLLTPVEGSDQYVIADPALRYRRAFRPEVRPGDLTPSSGTVVEVIAPVGAVRIQGGAPPYTLSAPTGSLWELAPMAGFLEWQLELEQQLEEATTLGMTFRRYRRTVRSWSARAERFWIDGDFLLYQDGTKPSLEVGPFVVAFYVNAEETKAYRYVGLAHLEAAHLDVAPERLVRQPLRFQGIGPIYFRDSSN